MKESCEAIRLLDSLYNSLSRWYQNDNTDGGTLLALEMLQDDVDEIRRAVWEMEEELRETRSSTGTVQPLDSPPDSVVR